LLKSLYLFDQLFHLTRLLVGWVRGSQVLDFPV